MNAATKLFSEQGYGDVTTHGIATEAGVSVGSFYNYFNDKKEALLAALGDVSAGVQHGMQEVALEIEPDALDEKLVLELINTAITLHRSNAGLARIIEELRYSDPDIREYSQQFQSRFSSVIQLFLISLEGKNELKIENIETKAKILMVVIEALCHENIFHDLGIEDGLLAGELKDLVMRYLMID